VTAPQRSTMELARHWLSIDRPDRALDELGKLAGDDSLRPEALAVRTAALHNLQRHTEACAAAELALGRYGPEPQLLAIYGSSLRAVGQHAKAERAFLDGLAIDPEDPLLLCWYARVCLEVGQVDKAERLVDRAASHAPDDDLVAKTRVLIAYARGKDADAVAYGRESLRLDPEDPHAHALHGMAAAARGDLGAAESSLRRAAAANPGDRDIVEAAREIRVANHPLMRPLWPVQRFGMLPVWLCAVGAIMLFRFLRLPGFAALLGGIWLLYCIYSWTVPFIVKRLVRR
jgi:tetratricopeptide (TPR) repeat protein